MGWELWNSKDRAWLHWSTESLLMIAGYHPAHQMSRGMMVSDPRAVALS